MTKCETGYAKDTFNIRTGKTQSTVLLKVFLGNSSPGVAKLKKTVLLTGATGFIGTQIARLLLENEQCIYFCFSKSYRTLKMPFANYLETGGIGQNLLMRWVPELKLFAAMCACQILA